MFAEIVLSVAMSTGGTPTHSDTSYLSIQRLASMCRGMEQGISSDDHLLCLTYIAGFIGGHEASVQLAGARPMFCLPELATQEQLALVFVRWADNNPEHLHAMPEAGLALAFASKFACRSPR